MHGRILAVFFAVSLSSCASEDKPGPTAPDSAEETSFKLKVMLGEGVTGQPSAGEYNHSAGTEVSYSFSTLEGFRNLSVEAGAAAMPASGLISITSDTALFAVAEKIPEESPQAEPVEEAADEVSASSDSSSAVQSYEEYISAIGSLYASLGRKSARELVLEASRASYARTSNEAFNKAEDLLAGNVFAHSAQSASRNLVSLRSLASSARGAEVAVIFVNGILTAVDGPAIVLSELDEMFGGSSILAGTELYAFYNPSGLYTSSCIRRAIQLGAYTLWRTCGKAADLSQSLRQVAELMNFLPVAAEPESLNLAKLVLEERAAGKRVVLISHSQGNLVVRQALDEIGAFDPCIAVSALASPGSRASMNLPETHLRGFVVSGDIILSLGANDFPKVETALSRQAAEEFSKISNVPVAYLGFKGASFAERLHSMAHSYLAAPESYERLRGILEDQVSMLSGNADCSVPSSIRLYAASGHGRSSGPSDLWVVPPYATGADTLVARIRTPSGYEPVITDIAERSNGELWAVSFNRLYKLDKATGLITDEWRISGLDPNSLAFNASDDLYLADTNGEIWGVDVDNMEIFWEGDFGPGYDSAGDMAFSPDGRWFALVEDREGESRFAELSLSDGSVQWTGEAIGEYQDVFGLAFAGAVPFGFTAADASGKGSLLRFDIETGQPELVRKLAFGAFGAAGNRIPD